MSLIGSSCGLILSFAVAAPSLLAQGAKAYENPEFGYRIRPPREWVQIPLQSEERWQTAKWMSERPYFYTEPGSGWTFEHKPELVVIAFPKDTPEPAKEEPPDEKKKEPKGVVFVFDRYKDYLDYLKRTNFEGGFYVNAEKELDLGDHKVTCYEIKLEKLARTGPKRIITWVHHTPTGDLAVQIDVLEDSYKKLEKTVLDAQKSFGLIAATGAGRAAGPGFEKVPLLDEASLGPAERKSRRLESEKRAHETAKATLTEGWKVLELGRFVILNHADEKYARRVAEQAEAVVKWCESTFPFVGPEEYVRRPVIRICADFDEMASFYGGGGAFFFFGERLPEIVTFDDQEGFQTSNGIDFVNERVLELWFQDRDRDLWFAMPDWLGSGLEQLIAKSRLDKGKLAFRDDEWGRDQLRDLIRNGSASAPRALLHMTVDSYVGGGGDTWMAHHYQSGALLRYLTVGSGAKSSRTKDLMRDYVVALRAVVTEMDAAEDAGKGEAAKKKPKTEEEEEEYFRQKNQEWKNKEQQLLDRTFDRCFRTWTDSDWSAFTKAYFDSI